MGVSKDTKDLTSYEKVLYRAMLSADEPKKSGANSLGDDPPKTEPVDKKPAIHKVDAAAQLHGEMMESENEHSVVQEIRPAKKKPTTLRAGKHVGTMQSTKTTPPSGVEANRIRNRLPSTVSVSSRTNTPPREDASFRLEKFPQNKRKLVHEDQERLHQKPKVTRMSTEDIAYHRYAQLLIAFFYHASFFSESQARNVRYPKMECSHLVRRLSEFEKSKRVCKLIAVQRLF